MTRNIHPHVMRALDDVADTVKWWTGPKGLSYGSGFIGTVMESTNLTWSENTDDFGKREAYRLSHSPLYWVERDMVDLLLHAVKTFPAKRLWPEDLPSPSGLVYFEKPIYMPDRHGKMLGLKAVEWFTSPMTYRAGNRELHAPMGALSLSFYNHRDDPKDENNQDLIADGGLGSFLDFAPPLGLYHYLPWTFGTYWKVDAEGNYHMSLPMMNASNPTREQWDEAIAKLRTEREDELPDGAMEIPPEDHLNVGAGWYSLMDCLWTLLQQRITRIGSHRPDRATARRVAKVMHEPEIQVVTLRRPESVYASGREVEPTPGNWSHRWLVEGFWRWQWYPSEGIHRRIWIEPYIKGPQSLPLKVKDKAYAWRQ